MELNRTKLNTRLFTYDVDTNCLSAEYSDLSGGEDGLLQPMYDDACDVGIVLVSHKTGKEVRMVLEQVEMDGDNDVQWWKLVPTAEARQRNPELSANFHCIIWND